MTAIRMFVSPAVQPLPRRQLQPAVTPPEVADELLEVVGRVAH